MASSSSPSASDNPEQLPQLSDGQSPSSPPAKDECVVHKTKTIQFNKRSTPIILQKDNGPCPLLAICNVLLLKNQISLSPDTGEVSQEKLLALVAERLIDSNSNVNNKDADYLENQQQNISDVMDLLPNLRTGIDVNIQFRRINDFEYTRECAIFDLLDIPLYHGWLIDPQDKETAEAIGSKSYNTITSQLVSLAESEEDCVDFVAATTATLGVPSPSLSSGKSFEDSPRSVSEEPKVRKGDALEEEELLRALSLSQTENCTGNDSSVTHGNSVETTAFEYDEFISQMTATPVLESDNRGVSSEPSQSGGDAVPSTLDGDTRIPEVIPENTNCLSPVSVLNDTSCPSITEEGDVSIASDVSVKAAVGTLVQSEGIPVLVNNSAQVPESDQVVSMLSTPVVDLDDTLHTQCEEKHSDSTGGKTDSSLNDQGRGAALESLTSSLNGSEPIYEGEECIVDSKTTVIKDQEPVYEGETVLAEDEGKVKDREPVYEGEMALEEQSGKETSNGSPAGEITPAQGKLIKKFLKNSADQLTIYGLFSLQDGVGDRQLCVFFRNNHFNTMYKYQGDLYILATDQGYINQPDLVWEKLNSVNGDTVFVNSDFEEFKLESWDDQSAVANSKDYYAGTDNALDGSQENSDLQLALALQQQEFEEQPQRQAAQHSSGTGNSRMVTGPQQHSKPSVKPSSSSSPRQDSKSKDKCTIM